MAPTDREERRQMRQRGAGTRELQNVNFGFSFTAAPPLQTRSSSRRTPRKTPPVIPARSSARRTPQPLPARVSSRKTPITSSKPVSAVANRRVSSARRASRTRSIEPGQNQENPPVQPPTAETLVTPLVSKKRGRKSLKSVNEVGDAERVAEQEVVTSSGHRSNSSTQDRRFIAGATPKTPATQEQVSDELNADDQEHLLSSEKKRAQPSIRRSGSSAGASRAQSRSARKSPFIAAAGNRKSSIAAKSKKSLPPRLSKSSNQPSTSTRKTRTKTSPRNMEETEEQEEEADSHEENEKMGGEEEEEDNDLPVRLSRTQRMKQGTWKTRKSATSQNASGEAEKPDHDSVNLSSKSESTTYQKGKARAVTVLSDNQDDDDLSALSERHATKSASPYNRQRAHRRDGSLTELPSSSRNVPRSQVRTKPGRTTQENGELKQAKQAKRPNPSSSSASQPKQKRYKRDNAVPITVYRVYNPNISSNDADELENAPVTHRMPRLDGVNAVDVLGQITSEILSRRLQLTENQISSEQQASKRTGFKRKYKVIQEFAAVLSDRLFELTEAVDASMILKKQLKELIKEKGRMREEFLETRKQREDIALRMASLRQQHTAQEKARAQKEDLSTAMFDIEVAIQRGKDRAKELDRESEGPNLSLNMMLASVARSVGSSNKGTLARVKEFNTYLDRGVDLLEGRV